MRILQSYLDLFRFASIQEAECFNIRRTCYINNILFLRKVRIQSMFNLKFYQKCLEEALRSDVGFTDERGISLIINKLKRKKCEEDSKKVEESGGINLSACYLIEEELGYEMSYTSSCSK